MIKGKDKGGGGWLVVRRKIEIFKLMGSIEYISLSYKEENTDQVNVLQRSI